MELLKNFLLLLGLIGLIASIRPIRRLTSGLPPGGLRSLWHLLLGLVCLFVVGYFAYLVLFWGTAQGWVDLVVPSIFFLGAIFVLLVCWLSFRTSLDLRRIYVLEQEATLDSLTGVYNRRHFDRRLREEFSVAKRHGQPLALIMIDIDFFKKINDECGHPIGDLVLERVAEILAASVREGDIVCRFGGEEFAVILPHVEMDGACRLAERLRERIQKTEVLTENASPSQSAVRVTISVGVATQSDAMTDSDMLVSAADAALYLAKERGRNQVVAAS